MFNCFDMTQRRQIIKMKNNPISNQITRNAEPDNKRNMRDVKQSN